MLRDRDARRFIFVTKSKVDSKEVDRILAAIRSTGRNLKNRTHLHPELANWKKAMPLPLPPLGKTFVLESILFIDGTAPLAFIDKSRPEFYQRILDQLSHDFRVSFDVELRAPAPIPDLRADFALENGKVYLSARTRLLGEQVDPGEWIAAYQKVVDAGKLPITLRYAKGEYVLKHVSGGELKSVANSKDSPPAVAGGTLPGCSVGKALDQFREFIHRPEFCARRVGWCVAYDHADLRGRPKPDALRAWQTINRIGFPRGKVEADFFWHLKDYTLFKAMPLMTELMGLAAAQSLLDFEYGDGKKCQLDALCDKKGQYRLFFSVDGELDDEELSTLFKVKLKEYD